MTDPTTPEIDFDTLVDSLHQAIELADAAAAIAVLNAADDDTARLIDRLSGEDRQALFGLLTPEQGAEVLEHVYYFQGADIIEELSAKIAAPFVAELDSDDRADLMNELTEKDSKAILEELDADLAHETRRFMAYPEGTAGAIMYSEYVSFGADMTVEDILNDIQ
jgi:magnesium transporter